MASSSSSSKSTTPSTTPFQERVYALLRQVPEGSVTTYGAIARALRTSPRAVGNALRNNPYAPQVPCHRCIASNGYINGFSGELVARRSFMMEGIDSPIKGSVTRSTKNRVHGRKPASMLTPRIEEASQVQKKMDMLKKEGVHFDHRGIVRNPTAVLYNGPWNMDSDPSLKCF
ncbi:hypothetical protein KEM54_000462 [Ascosphaera aggregata]|nr:hypothetical protein KEM54_000462 [Ascosphaera aggregata]